MLLHEFLPSSTTPTSLSRYLEISIGYLCMAFPSFVRTADSFTSFRSQLKTYMFARHL